MTAYRAVGRALFERYWPFIVTVEVAAVAYTLAATVGVGG